MSAEPSKHAPPRVAIAIELDHAEPWHQDCYQGILNYAQKAGWSCVVDPMLLGVTGEADLDTYDGAVGRIGPEAAQRARAHNLPVVNHWLQSDTQGLPSVFIDQVESTRLAAEHLLVNGYRRLATIELRHTEVSNRMSNDGMRKALAAHDAAEHQRLFIPYTESGAQWLIEMRRVLVDWLNTVQTPVGVFVRAWYIARYFEQICRDMGLHVPGDVGIVCGEINPQIASTGSPTLSGIEFDFLDMGYQAAAMLDRIMHTKQDEHTNPANPANPDPPPVTLIPPKRLIVRESSDAFISADPLVSQAMTYIAEHIRQAISVDQLAKAMQTSRRTLYRRFDAAIGRSVNEEIARMRTDQLKRVLAESDLPLAKVAADHGFSSASHFTHFFRRETGSTPSAYRKQFTQQPADTKP